MNVSLMRLCIFPRQGRNKTNSWQDQHSLLGSVHVISLRFYQLVLVQIIE